MKSFDFQALAIDKAKLLVKGMDDQQIIEWEVPLSSY